MINHYQKEQTYPSKISLLFYIYLSLLFYVLDNNFFMFQNDHFKQIFGCPMGSPVSAILANLVMEYVEEKALLSAPNSPKWWFRYVDDSHVCIKREHVAWMNSTHTSILLRPTSNLPSRQNQKAPLPFLTQKQPDKTMARSPCLFTGKLPSPTTTLTSNDTTTPQHKYLVVRTLMDRAKNIPSTEEEAIRETKRVAEALTANNYPANFIYNGRQRNRQQELNDTNQRGMVVLPYAKRFSERIVRVLRGFNIKVAHKPIRTISNILKKPKDKIQREASRGIVYKIKCKDCDCVYISQT